MTHAFIWLVDAAWIGLVVDLTVSAIGVKRDTKPHLAQSFGLLVAMIVALLLPRLPIFKFVNFVSVGPILSSVGLAITVAGMTLLVWARQTLGRNWSQTVSAKEDHELVASGPYRYVRHPMYTGGIPRLFRFHDRRRQRLRVPAARSDAALSLACARRGRTSSAPVPAKVSGLQATDEGADPVRVVGSVGRGCACGAGKPAIEGRGSMHIERIVNRRESLALIGSAVLLPALPRGAASAATRHWNIAGDRFEKLDAIDAIMRGLHGGARHSRRRRGGCASRRGAVRTGLHLGQARLSRSRDCKTRFASRA